MYIFYVKKINGYSDLNFSMKTINDFVEFWWIQKTRVNCKSMTQRIFRCQSFRGKYRRTPIINGSQQRSGIKGMNVRCIIFHILYFLFDPALPGIHIVSSSQFSIFLSNQSYTQTLFGLRSSDQTLHCCRPNFANHCIVDKYFISRNWCQKTLKNVSRKWQKIMSGLFRPWTQKNVNTQKRYTI